MNGCEIREALQEAYKEETLYYKIHEVKPTFVQWLREGLGDWEPFAP